MENKNTVILVDYDEKWVEENKCFKSSNSLNNTRSQGVARVQAYLKQIWEMLVRLLTAVSQWHDGAAILKIAILKTAGLPAEITDSDAIQDPSKGPLGVRAMRRLVIVVISPSAAEGLKSDEAPPREEEFLYEIMIISRAHREGDQGCVLFKVLILYKVVY